MSVDLFSSAVNSCLFSCLICSIDLAVILLFRYVECFSYVSNLEKYGLVLKDVAKLFSKKFACSSTVTKEDNGTECITLTGEFGYDIVDFLVEKFPALIKPEMCKVMEPKK